MPLTAIWIDLEIILLSEVSQGKTYLYVESKKKWYKEGYLQNRNRLTNIENKLMAIKGEREGEDG